jgi:hypothetical protein
LNKIFEIKISRPGSFGEDTSSSLSLPATPYELLDALDKARMIDERVIYSNEILSCELAYLPQLLSPSINLYELNHLAQRLSALSEWDLNCFEGMVMMDTIKNQHAPIAIERLINMTHSTESCQIVHEASDDESLGRFYAEYDFVPELETLPEKVFAWLDYGKIGKEMREGEDGVFTPNGYVVQNGEIEQIYQSGDAIHTQKPDYTVILKVTKEHFKDSEYDNEPTAFLKLPAAGGELHQAIEEIDVTAPEKCVFTAVDCIIPQLTEKITDHLKKTGGGSYGLVNELAMQLRRLSRKDEIPIFKAILEVAPENISLEEALDLYQQTVRFSLMREMSSPSDYAAKEVQRLMSYDNDKGLEKYFDLPGYGRYIMEKNGITETSYGMLEPLDGQTVEQCLGCPEHHMKLE